MQLSKYIIYLLLTISLFSCYSVSPKIYQQELLLNYSSTNIKKVPFSGKYKNAYLKLGELSLGGEIKDIMVLNDTLLFVGLVVDVQGKPQTGVRLHPIQELQSSITKNKYYKVYWDIHAETNDNGIFKLKVPASNKVHGLIRYLEKPPKRISAWIIH